MEKKFKFSDNPNLAKTIYGIVVAVLCVTAIIIGIVAANSRNDDTQVTPPAGDGPSVQEPDETPNDTNPPEEPEDNKTPAPQKFIAPVSGTVTKNHSLTIPVFSTTLEEWRVHAGIDISCADSAPVFAASDGEVTKVYNHPMLGTTVEITHNDGIKTVYANLSADGSKLVKEGTQVEMGEQIGVVGDTSISELAEETHLHFEMTLNDECIDPLSYLSEESKEASLGIDANS